MTLDLLSDAWSMALGWTLLHSLWQGLLVFGVVRLVNKYFFSRSSSGRYAAGAAGLVFFFVLNVSTLLYLLEPAAPGITLTETMAPLQAFDLDPVVAPTVTDVGARIEQQLPTLITGWLVGCAFLLIRLMAGLWSVGQLRQQAQPVTGRWHAYLQATARRMGIRLSVSLAESPRVTSPLVVGWLKPMVLVPTGMLTGLSIDQLETIFCHELAHIRRHDYLVNIFQSLLEAFFFFNPFVWILSADVRREREYCCDDFVVHAFGSRRVYARALTRLAEMKLARRTLGVALADDKFELLNRIKRIMNTSAGIEQGRTRGIVPVLVLVVALGCISWMGTRQNEPHNDTQGVAATDTVPVPRERAAAYSRQEIVTYDEHGQPHTRVVEKFEGDESLRPLVAPDATEARASVPIAPAPRPVKPAEPHAHPDTIPPPSRPNEWRALSDHLQEELKTHLEELRAHMEALRKEHEGFRLEKESWQQIRDSVRARVDSARQMMGTWSFDFDFPDEEAFAEVQKEMERLHEAFRTQAFQFRHDAPASLPPYQQALREALVKDGYLEEDEPIEQMQWSENTFRVNGKDIRKEHLEKYKKLQERYFGARS